jgi:hypothetical protein
LKLSEYPERFFQTFNSSVAHPLCSLPQGRETCLKEGTPSFNNTLPLGKERKRETEGEVPDHLKIFRKLLFGQLPENLKIIYLIYKASVASAIKGVKRQREPSDRRTPFPVGNW